VPRLGLRTAPADTWGDVFLRDENEKPLKQVSRQIEAKKEQLANRGIILMGPPGTGKTLSGRVLRNETPSATFIWISARS
jgi:ATP-dependent 26S proteasome regulatory subunit